MKYKTVNWITNKKSPHYKPQASSAKLRKLQAASCKPQAARFKRQAASDKLLDIGSFIKFHGASGERLYHDKTILRMCDVVGNLVW